MSKGKQEYLVFGAIVLSNCPYYPIDRRPRYILIADYRTDILRLLAPATPNRI